MNEASEIYEYKNYKFLISVQLGIKTEKKIGSKKWHQIIINDMGVSNFYKKEVVIDKDLEKTIIRYKKSAKSFVDEIDHKSKDQIRLEGLGFKF
jgi:hypothetical protein